MEEYKKCGAIYELEDMEFTPIEKATEKVKL